MNPIEEALGYHSLVNDFNLTQAKVAERVGKSRVHITNLLRLLKLHEELRVLLSEGKLSTGHAKVLLGIEDLNDQLKIGKQAIAEGWTVRHCEIEVQSFLNLPLRIIQKFLAMQTLFRVWLKKLNLNLVVP